MHRRRSLLVALITLVLTVLSMGSLAACKLPVFRYALERWVVDRYRLVAIVENAESPTARDALVALQAMGPNEANLDVEVIELSKLTEAELWQVEGIEDGLTSDRLQVYYPPKRGESRKCWEGELTVDNVKAWVDSPLRQSLAEEMIAGVSAVWIQIDGPDEAVNTRVATDLEAALRAATTEISIPDGVIPRAEAREYLSQHPEASMDDVLRCDVPLKVDFRMHRLSPGDTAEWATVRMIRGLAGESDRPLLVPVFGRGRMLDAIPTTQVEPATILRACTYMVSECSCTVKALNPGADLLLNVDWQRKLGAEIVMVGFDQETDPVLLEVPIGKATDPPAATPVAQVEATRKDHLVVLIAIALSIVICWRLVRRADTGTR